MRRRGGRSLKRMGQLRAVDVVFVDRLSEALAQRLEGASGAGRLLLRLLLLLLLLLLRQLLGEGAPSGLVAVSCS